MQAVVDVDVGLGSRRGPPQRSGIEASPRPDDVAKRETSAYPGTGLVIAIYDDLVIGYVLDGDVVLFLRMQERADLHEDAT